MLILAVIAPGRVQKGARHRRIPLRWARRRLRRRGWFSGLRLDLAQQPALLDRVVG
jgi:hypothetical protein